MSYHVLISDRLSQEGIDLLEANADFRVTAGGLSREEALAAAR
jgi:hypothetical protein